MMVLFTSRSEKKALSKVRQILDTFANRIGNDTWQTVITAEGLLTIKTLLRKNATKNMAVACYWLRSRSSCELLWIVGNRNHFNALGRVPIYTTSKNIAHPEWENDWQYLPLVQSLTAMTALLHDWSKSSKYFQYKLQHHLFTADPLRHEWISCKLLEALVVLTNSQETDANWLHSLCTGKVDEKKLKTTVRSLDWHRFATLPPLASILSWLILSHHRLPTLTKEQQVLSYKGCSLTDWETFTTYLNSQWGYENKKNIAQVDQCFTFPKGILLHTAPRWLKNIKKWAGRLERDYPTFKQLIAEPEKQKIRPVLFYARFCLMLGDHYISSLPRAKKQDQWSTNCWANTDSQGRGKQYLEEHLVRVMQQSLKIAYQLPRLQHELEPVYDFPALHKKSPKPFSWQDKAVNAIRQFRQKNIGSENSAYFVVNMASTGCGKTFANAKIMRALSPDGKSLRYSLALGLRTLTLQTGDEYRKRLGLDKSELAVLIGSKAVQKLHDQDSKEMIDPDDASSLGQSEDLFAENLDYLDTSTPGQQAFLNLFFTSGNAEKNKAFLYKPVLVSTIDQLMGATETTRGGRYLLPCLRLLSADLVIDEIDDFGKKDLLAIARLVHLAGMLGRNVALSSATIPPDLALGMYRAYLAGLREYNNFFLNAKTPVTVLCDEYRSQVAQLNIADQANDYQQVHEQFVQKRIASLKKQIIRRRGTLCSLPMPTQEGKKALADIYFEAFCQAAERLHEKNYVIDKKSGKKVSLGLIRLANVDPCVACSQYAMQRTWKADYAVRLMVYHSRQLLLLRHEQEKYLDHVLKRDVNYGEAEFFTDPILRQHIDQAKENNLLFIVVATPVEEVGRDHDFDWAVVEPSSYRSIIQLAGRVLRHRQVTTSLEQENIVVMTNNLKGYLDRTGKNCVFSCPGYESGRYRLETHDLTKILDEKLLSGGINAIPRLQKNSPLQPTKNLCDLEQQVMQDFQDNQTKGPAVLHGWDEEDWWLTGLPQRLNPFREETRPTQQLFCLYQEGTFVFKEKTETDWAERTAIKNIHNYKLSPIMQGKLWLSRDYGQSLRKLAEKEGEREEISWEDNLTRLSKEVGEIVIPTRSKQEERHYSEPEAYYYSDQLGMFKMKEE